MRKVENALCIYFFMERRKTNEQTQTARKLFAEEVKENGYPTFHRG